MNPTILTLSRESEPLKDRIRERAYFLWLERGRPQGDERAHWLTAERQLLAEIESVAEIPPHTEGASTHFSIRSTVSAHLSDPTHRFHGPGPAHDGRLNVVAGEARQRVRGRRLGSSLRAQPKPPGL